MNTPLYHSENIIIVRKYFWGFYCITGWGFVWLISFHPRFRTTNCIRFNLIYCHSHCAAYAWGCFMYTVLIFLRIRQLHFALAIVPYCMHHLFTMDWNCPFSIDWHNMTKFSIPSNLLIGQGQRSNAINKSDFFAPSFWCKQRNWSYKIKTI